MIPGVSGAIVEQALAYAASQVGVRETSRNGGREVDMYLESVDCPTGLPWCAAGVYWCFAEASMMTGLTNPCPKTAGALRMFTLAPIECQLPPTATPEPGWVFVIDHGHGLGHVGFVLAVHGDGLLDTIEFNTNGGGSREGDGVYQRTRRRHEVTKGYLDFGAI